MAEEQEGKKPTYLYQVQLRGAGGDWPVIIGLYADTIAQRRVSGVTMLTFKMEDETVGYFENVAGWWIQER